MDNNTKQTDLEKEYLESLDEKQLQAYNIAKNHLGESYSLVKSNGFLEFLKQRKETQTK
jgi:competence protein ComGC|tara:strand:+ start:3945 stop:4121 length:177 start_codon:yes stop_codon:yes gene_type:complete